jgi:hypothetical protein
MYTEESSAKRPNRSIGMTDATNMKARVGDIIPKTMAPAAAARIRIIPGDVIDPIAAKIGPARAANRIETSHHEPSLAGLTLLTAEV